MANKARYSVAALTVVAALLAGTSRFEGKANNPYVDRLAATRVVTVCYGHTATAKLGESKTDAECNELLLKDLNTVYAPIVRKHVTVPLSQGEFTALVDFTYNLGEGNLRKSTLLRKVNAKDYAGAAEQFAVWKYTDGKDCTIRANKCYGIIERRAWEKEQFLSVDQPTTLALDSCNLSACPGTSPSTAPSAESGGSPIEAPSQSASYASRIWDWIRAILR